MKVSKKLEDFLTLYDEFLEIHFSAHPDLKRFFELDKEIATYLKDKEFMDSMPKDIKSEVVEYFNF